MKQSNVGIIFLFTYDKKQVSLIDAGPSFKPFSMIGGPEEIVEILERDLKWQDPVKIIGHYTIGEEKVTIYASVSTFIDRTLKNTTYRELEFFDIERYTDSIEPTLMISIELALGNIHFDVSNN